MDWIAIVGESRGGAGDGAPDGARAGKTGELIAGHAHGAYYEGSGRGNRFWSTTAVAGVAPGTVFSTTPPAVIWNPPNSGVLVSIDKVVVGYISGTLGAGHLLYGQAAQLTAPTGGTELTSISTMIGSFMRGGPRAFQGSTLSATPTLIRPSGIVLGAFVGGADSVKPPLVDNCGGEFVLAPGNVFVVQGQAGAGTSPLMTFGICYELCPLT